MTNTETVKDTSKDQLRHQVESIAATLTNGFADGETNIDGDHMTAMDYIFDALDIEYTVSGDKKTLLGATITVAFGGPSIYINTRHNRVEGYWWGETYFAEYTDNVGLDDAIKELWEC